MAKTKEDALGRTPRPLASAANLARIAAGIALLALLYCLGIIDIAALGALASRPDIVALAMVAALASIPLEALRWHILLRSQGLTLRLGRTTRILATSLFFANFLPGAAGGDLIRGVYIYNAAEGRRTPALLSIFIDRLIGLIAFVLVGLVAVLLLPSTGSAALRPSIAALSALFMAALAAVVLFGQPMGRLLRHALSGWSLRLLTIIDDLGAALRQYARDWRSTGLALLISVALAVLAVAPIVLIAEAMQIGTLSLLGYAVAGLYALIANSLPVTPGGLGVGEAAFASVCVIMDPQAAHAAYGTIFLAFRCIFILSTVPGLVAYLIYS
ncbi:MAG: lysylphosphatidylglycerol synthase transmembrane domain-containing protein [Alphaproteobacteria bacterium]